MNNYIDNVESRRKYYNMLTYVGKKANVWYVYLCVLVSYIRVSRYQNNDTGTKKCYFIFKVKFSNTLVLNY